MVIRQDRLGLLVVELLAEGDDLETYLETVCLRAHVAGMSRPERSRFLKDVAAAMPEPIIDYLRLNISARRRL